MNETYCQRCEKEINTTPFIGEKFFKFKDGIYCEHCAKVKVEENRKKKK